MVPFLDFHHDCRGSLSLFATRGPSEVAPPINQQLRAGSCIVAEMFYTFVLVFVVLNCAASRRTNPANASGPHLVLCSG